MTIRGRLAAALALALFPIFLLAIVQAAWTLERQQDERRVALLNAARQSTQRAAVRLETASVVLEALGPRATGLGCAPILRNAVDRLTGYEALTRFDRLGRVVCASRSVTPADYRNEPWFRRLAAGEARVVEASPPEQPGEPATVFAAVAVRDANGAFDGAQVAEVKLISLEPDRSGLPPGTVVGLLTAEGAWLGVKPREVVAPPQGWRDRLDRTGAWSWDVETEDGEHREQVISRLAPGAYAVLSAPDPGFVAAAWADPVAILLLPLLGWAIAFGAVWVVAERIILRWLVYLDRIAGIYARGRFSVRPVQAENAPAEIRHLARTLDDMAETIVWRDQSLRDSLSEKDVLMREIHHRVKNNLQIITSLLNMQQRALADPAARSALSDTRQRITALAIIYRALYQSEDLKRVDIRLFLSELLGQLMSGESRRERPIHAELHADSLIIDPDKLAPFALFAVEAITNAQKHAFPDCGGRLDVRFVVRDGEAVLEVIDDGVGADPEQAGSGVGRTLMTAFARQLRGVAESGSGPDGRGTLARLRFPTAGAGADPVAGAPEGNRVAA